LKIKDTDQKSFLEDEIKPIAIKRLERSLILDEAARIEGIEISEEELQKEVTATMAQLFNMPGFEKPSSEQDLRKLTNVVSFDTASRILNQKILNKMMSIAKGEAEIEDTEEKVDSKTEETGENQTPELGTENESIEAENDEGSEPKHGDDEDSNEEKNDQVETDEKPSNEDEDQETD